MFDFGGGNEVGLHTIGDKTCSWFKFIRSGDFFPGVEIIFDLFLNGDGEDKKECGTCRFG